MGQIRRLAFVPLIAALACGGEDLVLPDDSAPRRIELEGGGGQQGPAGQALPESISVRVTDATGRPVQAAPIGVNLLDGGAVAPSTLRSGTDGRAAFRWTLGSAVGTQELEVGVGDSTGITRKITVTATALPGRVDRVVLRSGNGQVGQVNRPLQDSLVVLAEDAFGNPIAGVTVTWSTSQGTLSPSTVATGTDGLAAAQWTLGRNAGIQRATATVSVDGTDLDTPFDATALPGPPPLLGITIEPADSAVSGSTLSRQPVIQLRDSDGSAITTAGVRVTASVTGGTATLGGTASVNTNGQGRATFSNLALTGPTGSHSLTFTAPGYLAATSQPVRLVTPSPSASRSSITAQPATLPVGSTSTITVTVRSSNGTPIPGVTVTLSVSGTGNTLTQPSAPTNSAGVATGLLSATSPGTRNVVARVNGQAIGGDERVTFQAAGVSSLAIVSGDDQVATAGSALPNPLVVRARDAFGNAITGLQVTWQPSAGQANPASSMTDGSGVAQTAWILGGSAGNQSLTARVSVGGNQLTAIFTATATQPPSPVLALATQPADTATDGVPLNPQPEIQLRDAAGGALAQAGVQVTASAGSGGVTLGGTRTVATDGQGRAVFTDLVLSGNPGPVTLDFAAPGFTGVTSAPVELVPAGPSPGNSSFTVQPTTVQVDEPVTVTVSVRSPGGGPVAGASVSISASGRNNSITQPGPTNGSGMTTGTLTSTRAESKTITVQVGGQDIASGQQVDVQAGPPSAAETKANVPRKGEPGEPTDIDIDTEDAYGNRLRSGGHAASIGVLVTGANFAAPSVQDNGDGSYTATYTPVNEGTDLVLITINALPIQGNPFTIDVDD